MRCRQMGKPVIVASHLLQSMHEFPCPTRAEVADIADVVRQRADALMLSGESAAGAYPDKCIEVLRQTALRVEDWCRCSCGHGAFFSLSPSVVGLMCVILHHPLLIGLSNTGKRAPGPWCCLWWQTPLMDG